MRPGVPYKTKQFLLALIKLSIIVGAFYFIYSKLTENDQIHFDAFVSFISEHKIFSLGHIIVLCTLSDLNWLFEVLKWKTLVRSITPITFIDALEQSLAGHTASMITPNRLGDYGAKAVYYPKTQRGKIVLLNLIGHMAQMTVTTVLGLIGLLIFINRYQIEVDYYKATRFIFILIAILGFTIFGFRKQRFTIKGYSLDRIFNYLKSLPNSTHVLTLSFALIRYLIFSFQFYYLLLIFGVDVNYMNAMVVITSMYILASVIPTITLFDVVIKGSVAIFLFDFVDVNELTVLSISSLMWLLNFAVPALFGSYFVLNFKLPKSQI